MLYLCGNMRTFLYIASLGISAYGIVRSVRRRLRFVIRNSASNGLFSDSVRDIRMVKYKFVLRTYRQLSAGHCMEESYVRVSNFYLPHSIYVASRGSFYEIQKMFEYTYRDRLAGFDVILERIDSVYPRNPGTVMNFCKKYGISERSLTDVLHDVTRRYYQRMVELGFLREDELE